MNDGLLNNRLLVAINNLTIDAGTVEVLDLFDAAGVETILLRGPNVARHLWEGKPRAYTDADLLVRPDDRKTAERILVEMGFEINAVEGLSARPRHAVSWVRRADNMQIDLHRNLIGVAASEKVTWEVMHAWTEPMDLLERQVSSLGPAALAVVITLHAAQHGRASQRTIEDLRRALDLWSEDVWRDAYSLTGRLAAGDSFLAGLSLLSEGRKMASLLSPDGHSSMRAEVLLRLENAPPSSLSFAWSRSLRSPREKLSFWWRKLFPPRETLRATSALARRGLAGTIAAYIVRPILRIKRVYRGYRAWRKANRGL